MNDETVVVTFKAPKASLDLWKKISEAQGLSLADWIRTCLNTEGVKVNLEQQIKKTDGLKLSVIRKNDRLVEIEQSDKTVLFSIEYRPSSLLGHSRFVVRSTAGAVLLQGPFDFGTWSGMEMENLTKRIVKHLLPDSVIG